MPKAEVCIPSICEEASGQRVQVYRDRWKPESGDKSQAYGAKSDAAILSLPKGRCTQADLPDGCPYLSACTGKVRVEINTTNNTGDICLTVTNRSRRAPRTYVP